MAMHRRRYGVWYAVPFGYGSKVDLIGLARSIVMVVSPMAVGRASSCVVPNWILVVSFFVGSC